VNHFKIKTISEMIFLNFGEKENYGAIGPISQLINEKMDLN